MVLLRHQAFHRTGRTVMGRSADDARYVVQFPHPGREHRPGDTEWMPWNPQQKHARKFLRSRGRYVAKDDTVSEDPLVFWGEWEPPSRVIARWPRSRRLPRFLHEPVWHTPRHRVPRHNTDPWVFGKTFLYSNCKQFTPHGTPSALQSVTRGSLILFGSKLDHEFVLDTVFVAPQGRRIMWRWPATLVTSQNMAAIILSLNGRQAERIALALEQYLLTLVAADSKFDRALAGQAQLSDDEKRGFELFLTEFDPARGRHAPAPSSWPVQAPGPSAPCIATVFLIGAIAVPSDTNAACPAIRPPRGPITALVTPPARATGTRGLASSPGQRPRAPWRRRYPRSRRRRAPACRRRDEVSRSWGSSLQEVSG